MAMTKIEFYEAVGEILGTGHDSLIRSEHYQRSRWNNREPGNGRYPGHGLVRYFATDHITVTFQSGDINGSYASASEALAAIRKYADGRTA